MKLKRDRVNEGHLQTTAHMLIDGRLVQWANGENTVGDRIEDRGRLSRQSATQMPVQRRTGEIS